MNQLTPKGFVAAFNEIHLKANLSQDERQRPASFSTAPAVDQWLPVFWQVYDMVFNVLRNIGRHQACAFFLGFKWTHLFVESANNDPLFVVQRGPIYGAWQVIKGKLVFTSGVNDGAVSTGLSHWQSHSDHGFFSANWVHVHKTPFIGSALIMANPTWRLAILEEQ